MNVIQANPVLYSVWGLSIALEISLLAIVFVKKRHRKYPAFSSFVAFIVARSVVLVTAALTDSPYFYFYGYYCGIVIEAGILTWVSWEISVSVFMSLRAIPNEARTKFCCALSLAVVIVLASLIASDHHPVKIMAVGRAVERGVASASFAWFALLAFLSTYLRIPWRKHAFGIGAGFLVNLSVQAVGHTVFAGAREGVGQYLQMLLMWGFISSQIVWLYYLWHPEPDVKPVSLTQARTILSAATDYSTSAALLKAKGKFSDFTN